MDILDWLRSLGLEQYEPAFREHRIDGAILRSLVAEDLKDIGVNLVGHRRKLLDAIAALHLEAHPPQIGPRAVDDERRHVIVLFADLVGSTTFSNQLDAEEMYSLLNRFFECVDSLVEKHGGRIDKHVGDSVMAIFGAPIAHGNEAERAVRAALAIRDAMPALSLQIKRPTRVHIGVAGGQVVATSTGSSGHREYTITGDSVNLASRLSDAASAGEILISDRVRRTLQARVECVDAGMFAVKGFAEAVRAWRLIGLRDTPHENECFVGRTAELNLFRSALVTCHESGNGRAIYLRGEAGIGKTRLVQELKRTAEAAGFTCHTALVLDFGSGTGQDAIHSLSCNLLGLHVTSDAAAAVRASSAALETGVVAAEDAVFINDLLGVPQPTPLRALYDAMDNSMRDRGKRRALARLVEQASRVRPHVLIIEDIHWADRFSLTCMSELAVAAAHHPVLLVMTSRIDGDPLDREWRAHAAGGSLLTVDLGPLRVEEARALAAIFIDQAATFTERCIERAAGNPLFLEQLLRHAEESVIGAVPDSVQSLVQSRLDRLEPSDKVALQTASILGQRFAQDQLCFLLDRPSCSLDNLVSNQLVRPQGEVFMFTHALIRDAVYDTLLKSRRRDLHKRAAKWFARSDVVLRAEHLDRAEDAEAPTAYLEAAQSQVAEYRYELGLRLVQRGLELAIEHSGRFALMCVQGDILHDVGDMAAAGRAFDAALEVAATDDERCRAWIGRAAVKRITDDITGAFADLECAEAVALASGAIPQRARIHFLRGNLCFPRGDIDGCLREHERSLELARQAGLAELEAAALGGLGDAEYVRGRMISAHDRLRACVEICRQRGFGRIEVANLAQIAHTQLYFCPQQDALDAALHAASSAARVGHQRAELNARLAAFFALWLMGQTDRCRAEVVKAQELVRRLGARRFEQVCRIFLGWVALAEGERSEAIDQLSKALEISQQTGITFHGAHILGALAYCVNDADERRRFLAKGEAIIRGGCVGHNHLWFYRDAMETCLELHDYKEVERYAAAFENFTDVEPMPWSTYLICRGRTLAAIGCGRRDSAITEALTGLREEGRRLGLRVTLPAIEATLTHA